MAITKVTPSVSNFDSGLTVDNITIDGTEIDLSSSDLTLDVAGDIILDAGGGDIILKDDGTHWASLYTNGTNTYLQNMISDGDMYFSVNDGGSNVNALIIDGSAAGAATFNSDISMGGDITGTGDTKFLATGDIGIGPRQGSATNGAVYIGGNTDNPFVSPTAVFTGDQNVGIGTASPTSNAGWDRFLKISGGAHNAFVLDGTNSQEAGIGAVDGLYIDVYGHTTATNNNIIFRTQSANSNVNGIERMRITSAGNVGIGTNSPGNVRLRVQSDVNGDFTQYILQDNAGGYGMGVRSDSGAMIYFYIGGTYQGHIYSSGGATTYGQGSDYRLKYNVVEMSGSISIDNLKKLRPVTFNFKADEDSLPQQGFIAHEAQEVVPNAVTGQKDDPIDEEKQIGYQSMDYGKVTPLLTSALQEAIARIETLEAEVKALKEA